MHIECLATTSLLAVGQVQAPLQPYFSAGPGGFASGARILLAPANKHKCFIQRSASGTLNLTA
jgi:hypothetical protein